VYTSRLAPGLTSDRVEYVLQEAVQHNRLAGVTGILVHDGDRVIQYLEGPDDGLRSAMGRIENATSHVELVTLMDGRVMSRLFPNWAMRPFTLGSLEVTELTKANWQSALSGSPTAPGSPSGLQLMLAHVRRLG